MLNANQSHVGVDVKPERIEAAWRGQPECRRCRVRHLALFADLDVDDFTGFHMPIEDLSFAAGRALYRAGDPGIAVFTVRSGLVKLVQYLPNGAQRIVRLLRQGDTAGLEAVLGHDYQHGAVCMKAVSVCRIPTATIWQLNAKTPRLYNQLLERWQQAVRQADDWLTLLSTGSARTRLARLLIYLRGDGVEPQCELFSREEIASILGITTETASRLVAEFKRENLITKQSNQRFVCDFAALEKIADN